MAHGGTIFLDEVGDLPLTIQAKLLRILQDKTLERVGGAETLRVNVRVIAATNRDLEKLVREEKFREDLYYRLNVFPIFVPPLRERKTDILELANYFVEKYSRENNKYVRRISTPAIDMLISYHWPGNVRELEHAVEHVFVLVKGDSIRIEHLPEEVIQGAVVRRGLGGPPSARSILEESERRAIQMVLERLAWNKVAASRELGVSRTTLWRKMRKLGISN